jgi:hypothetical protein
MTTVAPITTRRAGAAPWRPPRGARALRGPETRRRTAAAVLLVLSGLVAAAALWLGLAWGAWAAGWPGLAAPLGLLGLLTLPLLGGALRAVGAVARPRRP